MQSQKQLLIFACKWCLIHTDYVDVYHDLQTHMTGDPTQVSLKNIYLLAFAREKQSILERPILFRDYMLLMTTLIINAMLLRTLKVDGQIYNAIKGIGVSNRELADLKAEKIG
jgi:hypothetical protein